MSGFILTACQRKGGVGRSTLLYNLAGAGQARAQDPASSTSTRRPRSPRSASGPRSWTRSRPPVDRLPPRRCLLRDGRVDRQAERNPRGRPGARVQRADPVQPPGARKDGRRSRTRSARRWPTSGATTTRSCATPRLRSRRSSWLPAVAADFAITPTPAEPLAVQELVHAGRFLERVRWSRNPRLVWLGRGADDVPAPARRPRGVLPVAQATPTGNLLFEHPIPYDAAFKECDGRPQAARATGSRRAAAAKAVDAVAGEILARVEKLRERRSRRPR